MFDFIHQLIEHITNVHDHVDHASDALDHIHNVDDYPSVLDASDHQPDHLHEHQPSMKFGGLHGCYLCPCPEFVGNGQTCDNCGHFWANHA